MTNKYDEEKVEKAITLLVEGIGDTLSREDTMDTPKRCVKMFKEILAGYDVDPKKYIKTFPTKSTSAVILRNVPIYSYCAHHLQPFYGKITIGYIPDGRVLGLSKLVRIARVFAKRLQLQENLTQQIAECIEKNVPNKGVAVSIKAQHMCMAIRGIRSPGSETVTTHLTGRFKDDDNQRREFIMSLSDKEGYN
jgi:GTP cyclohydrolase I